MGILYLSLKRTRKKYISLDLFFILIDHDILCTMYDF